MLGRIVNLFCFSALQRAEIAEIWITITVRDWRNRFSALQRAEIAEIDNIRRHHHQQRQVSVLFNEPKLLKCGRLARRSRVLEVSVLFNEPKLLKYG